MFLGFNSPQPDHMGAAQSERRGSLGLSHVCSLRSGRRQLGFTSDDAMELSKPFNGEGVLSRGSQARRVSKRGF